MGRVTISLGVATFPEDGADGRTLINAADLALYDARSAGRSIMCLARTSSPLEVEPAK